MQPPKLVLTILKENFSIHSLAPDASLPEAINECDFYSIFSNAGRLFADELDCGQKHQGGYVGA